MTATGARGPVLLVSYAGVLGGAERVLLDWAGALPGPVLLACPEGRLAAAARAAGFEVVTLRDRSLRLRGGARARAAAARSLAGLALDLAALARRRHPRAIVVSGQRPVLAATVAATGRAPVIALHHDLPAGPAIGRAIRWATRRCDAVVAVSAAVAGACDPSGRTHVVHPGVDLARWCTPAPPRRPPARALVLGALAASKRPDLALEVAARVPGLQLELVGEPLPGDPPELVNALHGRAARPDLAGRVTFSGALDDPQPALERAHLLLHCAEREGFGIALVEALAAGRPVVAPAAGGPLEIVATGGRLYAPGDAADAARAVEEVLADAGAHDAARARAEEAFDGLAAARRFAALVEAAEARRLVRPATPPRVGRP